jgi:hypothetical protein
VALGVGGKNENTAAEIVAIAGLTRLAAPYAAKALATPAGLVAASGAVGGGIGFVIEKEVPQYTAHAADVGSRVEKATGNAVLGGTATVGTVLPLFWAATKAYDLATRR